MIGSLLYLALGTRLDIACAVQTVSRFASNPGLEHWTALKRIFKYIAGTQDYELVYHAEGDKVFSHGYTDDRKLISGYAYFVADAAFAWSSKKQSTVALSSTEAEYKALAHATRQAIWNRNLLAELGYNQDEATVLYEDNQSAIAIACDLAYHARSKHFDVQNHFVWEKIENDIIELEHCSTKDMIANIFTKA
ncbi:uncharacterized protein ARMOST_21625 [Armillaria ostoyae]|uniref:Reverse transcriptase Ty1/copia-type domain-containing protein n=1 Tax=Armillaria ostoyae TaxID=47428 RepID=A0A284SAL0_ARMOS|nr:uncharacterized protein ARMOST_21625 [Armillaria ostoyae]